MTHTGFIITAWALVSGVLALYAARLVLRGRSLTKAVDPTRRRWMQHTDREPGKTS